MPDSSGETPVPTEELGAPAGRALDGAGITTLEQLAKRSEAEVEELHGVGPSALETLRDAFEVHGLSFPADVDDVDVTADRGDSSTNGDARV